MTCFIQMVTATLLAILLCACSTENAQKQVTREEVVHETYTAAQFFQTTSYRMGGNGPYAFSATNGDLLISSDETGVYNAYRLDVSTGQMTALTQSDDRGVYADSWFPDDDRFIYQQDGNGDELTHVFVMNPKGEVTDLTPGKGHKAGFAGWSSNGKAFFVFSNERDGTAFDLYRYDAKDYSRKVLYENSEGLDLGSISSDGRWVVYARNNSNADSDLFLIDTTADQLELVNITPHNGDIEYSAMGFTPDSSQLIYSTNEFGEFSQAWTLFLETGERKVLVADDWDVMYVDYSPSGRYRISGVNNDASTNVTLTDLATGEDLVLKNVPDGDLAQVRFNRDETAIAFGLNRDTAPYDLYHMPMGGQAVQLTQALNPAINSNLMVEGEVVRFASYDGLQIPGIIYKPREASAKNPAPAMVWVHGGPGGQSRKGYSATIQHLVNHGYAVFQINNRGSSGYGKTFYHLDDLKHGDADLGDVVASRAFLASHKWIDGERVGIIGGSYGGYIVAAALAFEPKAFDVGVNIFGVTNWVRTLESIPPWWGAFRTSLYAELGDPAIDNERLTAISPLFHAENIVKPLLVVQGANDPRVLQIESDELVDEVRANNVPVEYVLFEDEGHGFRKRKNRIVASEAYLQFLNKHL